MREVVVLFVLFYSLLALPMICGAVILQRRTYPSLCECLVHGVHMQLFLRIKLRMRLFVLFTLLMLSIDVLLMVCHHHVCDMSAVHLADVVSL